MVGVLTVLLFGMLAAWQFAAQAYVAGTVLAVLALYRARALWWQLRPVDDDDFSS